MRSQLLSPGEETLERSAVFSTTGAAITGSTLRLTYFTARRTETITKAITYTAGTATGTPTLCRIGIYTVGTPTSSTNAGALTLIASTPNDTAMWATITTQYTKNFSSAWIKRAGTRYAFGVLCVATTPPVLIGAPIQNAGMGMWPPALTSKVNTQTDLPTSVVATNNVESSIAVLGLLMP